MYKSQRAEAVLEAPAPALTKSLSEVASMAADGMRHEPLVGKFKAPRGRKKTDLSGQRFGRLVCTEVTDDRVSGSPVWLANCDCGTIAKRVPARHLQRENPQQSCGCLRRELSLERLSCVRSFVCVVCDAQFTSTRTCAKYCSKDCARSARKAYHLTRRAAQGGKTRAEWLAAVATPQRECAHCGTLFKPRGETNRFCSRACSARSATIYGSKAEARDAYRARCRVLSGLPPHAFEDRGCVDCGAEFRVRTVTDHTQCVPCREKQRAKQALRPRTEKPCAGCGALVVGTKSKTFCKRCRRKRSPKKHRARARRHGVTYEPINPLKVFERDGWRCQVCGVSTPKRARGTLKHNAPEMDHRIPISRGGPHTWDNVQCCCRKCNAAKSDHSVIGQMPLFARP